MLGDSVIVALGLTRETQLNLSVHGNFDSKASVSDAFHDAEKAWSLNILSKATDLSLFSSSNFPFLSLSIS